jgi:hypothetical protein
MRHGLLKPNGEIVAIELIYRALWVALPVTFTCWVVSATLYLDG